MADVMVLLNILKQLAEQFPLQQHFLWDVPVTCPLEIPKQYTEIYDKNIYLKEHFHHFLQQDQNLAAHYWVIQEWGGITSFKQTAKNDLKIREFLQILDQQKASSKLYDTLPSLSKVSSFLKPNDDVIYDSRVIYSLNWLIFKYDLDFSFFPQPATRNSQLLKYENIQFLTYFVARGYI